MSLGVEETLPLDRTGAACLPTAQEVQAAVSRVVKVSVRACRHVQPSHGAALQNISVQALSKTARNPADRDVVHVVVDEWSDRSLGC